MNEEGKRLGLASFQAPLLAPSDLLDMEFTLPSEAFPRFASEKYNGVRGLAGNWNLKGGSPFWLSRRQEPLAMADHIKSMFKPLLDWAVQNELVLDGEFYARSLNKVGLTMSVLQGTRPVPEDFMFCCFYHVPLSVWNFQSSPPMHELIAEKIPGVQYYKAVEQLPIDSWNEFLTLVEGTKNRDMEGYMLLDPKASYKHGKSTLGQGILLKYKYYSDPIDAQIYGIEPMNTLNTDLPRERNAIGRLKKIHSQDAYTSTNIGGTIWAKLKNGNVVKLPFPKGSSHQDRARYYREFGKGGMFDLKDKWVQFRRLSCENGKGAIAVKGVEFRD